MSDKENQEINIIKEQEKVCQSNFSAFNRDEKILQNYYGKSVFLKLKILKNIHPDDIGKAYESFKRCGISYTYYCDHCKNMSVKGLRFYFCNRRWCPICSRRESIKKAFLLAKTVSMLIEENYAKERLVPCMIGFTLHRSPEYSLRALLDTIKYALKIFLQGGTDAEVIKEKRAKEKKGEIYEPWWKKFFLEGCFARIEIPYNKVKSKSREEFAFGVHCHVLALRYLQSPVPLGINTETGEITGEGLRSLWTKYLQIAWKKFMPEFAFPHKENQAAQADIKVIYEKRSIYDKSTDEYKTVKVPLTKFFEENHSYPEIEEKIFGAILECTKYVLKHDDMENIIEQKKFSEFVKGIQGKQLIMISGIFKSGIMVRAKKRAKEEKETKLRELEKLRQDLNDETENNDENRKIDELQEIICGTKSWEEGKVCIICNSGTIHYGQVSLADAKIAMKRAEKKYLPSSP